MGKKEFEAKCRKEGHKPILREYNVGVPVDVKKADFILECSVCNAICIAKGNWNNPTD